MFYSNNKWFNNRILLEVVSCNFTRSCNVTTRTPVTIVTGVCVAKCYKSCNVTTRTPVTIVPVCARSLMGKMIFQRDKDLVKVIPTLQLDTLNVSKPVRMTPYPHRLQLQTLVMEHNWNFLWSRTTQSWSKQSHTENPGLEQKKQIQLV